MKNTQHAEVKECPGDTRCTDQYVGNPYYPFNGYVFFVSIIGIIIGIAALGYVGLYRK